MGEGAPGPAAEQGWGTKMADTQHSHRPDSALVHHGPQLVSEGKGAIGKWAQPGLLLTGPQICSVSRVLLRPLWILLQLVPLQMLSEDLLWARETHTFPSELIPQLGTRHEHNHP